MEVPEPHWEYSEGAKGFAVHGKDAELSGSVSPLQPQPAFHTEKNSPPVLEDPIKGR